MLPYPPTVTVRAAGVDLAGDLGTPAHAVGLVVFAHGSGSGRLSPRNRFVAASLEGAGLATLLVDLLTTDEQAEDRQTAQLRFDLPLLVERVAGAVDWAHARRGLADLPVGLFGAATGAAAALIAAADRPDAIAAVVSRSGRPDLAGEALPRVRAPTLLLVGEHDPETVAHNRAALAQLGGPAALEVIAGAGHLFGEPGAIEAVADATVRWMRRHIVGDGAEAALPGRLWQ